MIVGERFQWTSPLALLSPFDVVYTTTLTQPCRPILFISQKAEFSPAFHHRVRGEIPLRLHS